ncbi:MAG: fumarylacetoacetate hydrolase family protein [Chloroflexaceae bacterium]|nr:fumarylacetoacetate hydrolase family protein [Chloroflexaceae bacterium]
MKLATYTAGMEQRLGVVEGDTIIDITSVAPDMLTLIDGGAALLDQVRAALPDAPRTPLTDVQLLAPIPRPRKNIVCLGMNYAAHAYESARARGKPEVLPEHPVFFTKATSAINHPGGTIPYNANVSAQIDWEVELAFIIGRRGTNIAAEDALGYVFGYTILNDISARDLQTRHLQFYRSKSLDGAAPLGPWIVTADELADPHALGLRLRLNGETMQDATTADLIFNIPAIIATLAHGATLEPGDIISTGTPSGVAMGMNPPRWLVPGDVLEAEIDGIGVLVNTVGGA